MTPDERWAESLGDDVGQNWALLPWGAVSSVVAVMSWSEAQKHSGGSWRTKSTAHHFGKMVGHGVKHMRGQVLDDESGMPSLAHAAARALMCLGVHLAEDAEG